MVEIGISANMKNGLFSFSTVFVIFSHDGGKGFVKPVKLYVKHLRPYSRACSSNFLNNHYNHMDHHDLIVHLIVSIALYLSTFAN